MTSIWRLKEARSGLSPEVSRRNTFLVCSVLASLDLVWTSDVQTAMRINLCFKPENSWKFMTAMN